MPTVEANAAMGVTKSFSVNLAVIAALAVPAACFAFWMLSVAKEMRDPKNRKLE
eukprot:CAMPEP_0194267010 /NCGR_PEP_ID=MMETSP0169-20130528/1701_1 /TAXON_ID=218684 /ORGANISM="Corethron pennatum, Strain L29A3" /LENGTH=53 /DNA_ID=CAMNT_0039007803 /DNA_START=118 /DNA_END=279 /DNA_ORIENTATION=+